MVTIPQSYSILDASAMIAFLQGEPGAEVMESVLKDTKKKKVAHGVNMCEMYYHFLRQNNEAAAEGAVSTFLGLKVIVREDMDSAFWREVGQLKRAHTLALGDCFCIALAKRLGGEVVTSDHHEMNALVPLEICPILFIR